MIELLNEFLKDWRKKSEILAFLKENYGNVNERTFRLEKEKWNKLYYEHKTDKCIVHSNELGYKLTDNPKEIILMETDFIKRAKDMLYKAYNIKRARLENNNYSFEDFMEEQKKDFDIATTEINQKIK